MCGTWKAYKSKAYHIMNEVKNNLYSFDTITFGYNVEITREIWKIYKTVKSTWLGSDEVCGFEEMKIECETIFNLKKENQK